MSGSEEGFIEAGVSGRGYGFIDNSGHFAIPPVYSRADEFSNGYAHVQKDGKWLFLNKKGEEIRLSTKYEDIGHFSEGLCKVSVLKLGFMDLAYHSDNSEIAGNWGFVNEKGQEIVAPQYIYAYDFEDGIAIVCKGKWTKDSKLIIPGDQPMQAWDKYCRIFTSPVSTQVVLCAKRSTMDSA